MPSPRSKRRCVRSGGRVPLSSNGGDSSTVLPTSLGKEDAMEATKAEDHLSGLSLEIMCHVLGYLPLCDAMRVESLCRRSHEAVSMHLRLLIELDFTEGQIFGCMPTSFNDVTFAKFISRCPELESIYGLNPKIISKRRQRGLDTLSVPGVIEALQLAPKLRGIETCNIFLLEAVLADLPHLEILRIFQNRSGRFPIPPNNKLELTRNARITTLNLTGVVVSELPRMDFLKQLSLRWVKFTNPHPFRDFGVPLLRSFVMNNCAGPSNALKYVPLVTGLAAARSLTRLEMVRVPFLGGLIQHVVEDSWRMHGFRQLSRAVFGTCKHALEVDLGYLAITCANRLEELAVQPSLTKDSLFVSLKLADVDFPKFDTLHLGFVDDFPEPGKWSNEQLVSHGLADVTENPAMLTDIGMRAAGQAFPHIKRLAIYNCPHLHFPTTWIMLGALSFHSLKELQLRRCHAVRLPDFCNVLPMLPSLETLILEHMFREPPKGCSRVGLSAGTGLGVSSALVSNTGQDPNQDAGNNNQPGVVPANPGPVPNQPGIIPANHVVDNNEDDDDVDMDSEEEYDDLVWVPDDDEEEEDEEGDELLPVQWDGGAEEKIIIVEENTNNEPSEKVDEEENKLEVPHEQQSNLQDDKPAVSANNSENLANRKCPSPQPGPSSENDSKPSDMEVEISESSSFLNKQTSNDVKVNNVQIDEAHSSVAINPSSCTEQTHEGETPRNNGEDHIGEATNGSPENVDLDAAFALKTDNDRSVKANWTTSGAEKVRTSMDDAAISSNRTSSYNEEQNNLNGWKSENGSSEDMEELNIYDVENDRHDHSSSVTASLKSERDSPDSVLDSELPNSSSVLDNPAHIDTKSECKPEENIQSPANPISSRSTPQPVDNNIVTADNLTKSCSSAGQPHNSEVCIRPADSPEGGSINDVCKQDLESEHSKCGQGLNVGETSNESSVLSQPSTSAQSSPQGSVTCQGSSNQRDVNSKNSSVGKVGKGKSLRGKKKGLVKSSSTSCCSAQVNQSCQAVSEEIRETTKKGSVGTAECENVTPGAINQDLSKGHDSAEIPLQSIQPSRPSTSSESESSNSASKAEHIAADSPKVNAGPKDKSKDKSSCSDQANAMESGALSESGTPATQKSQTHGPGDGKSKVSKSQKARRTMNKKGNGSSRRGSRKKPTMCDQATSTSDPVIEEDHVQILTVRSSSLVSITLRHVGITDLVLQSCPRLNSLTGNSCRVLKNVLIKEAPRLQRVSFAQCRKLRYDDLVDEICAQPAEKNRLIFLRPMGDYEAESIQRQLFRSPKYTYHMCLIHDHSPDPEGTLHNRVRVSSWPDLLANINFYLLKFQEFPEACRARQFSKKYPWGRHMYTMTGTTEDGSSWEMVTDIPWLRPLAQGAQVHPLHVQDAAEGLYCPRAHGHKNTEACLAVISEDIAEAQEEKRPLYMHSAVVYVSTCDLNGRPTSDLYI